MRISKFKHFFEKGYTPNWTTEIFIVDKVKKTLPVTYTLIDSKGELIQGSFYEQELQKVKHPNVFLIEKVLQRKGNQVLVSWLGFSKDSNSWIDAKNVL